MNVSLELVEPKLSHSIATVSESEEIEGMFSYIAHALTESSIRMYKRDFQAYVDYAQERELDITNPDALAAFRDWMIFNSDKSPNTINRILSAANTLIS